jgi:hypothetical protein
METFAHCGVYQGMSVSGPDHPSFNCYIFITWVSSILLLAFVSAVTLVSRPSWTHCHITLRLDIRCH